VVEITGLIRNMGFGRRAVVLITDGVDTASKLSVDQAVELAKGVDLPVFVIRVLSPLDDPSNDAFVGIHGERARKGEALERFATETGGRLYEASQIGALHLASLRVKEELKTQYRMAYVPRDSRLDGRFRKIEVYVRLKDVEVRTRKGYFARKPAAGLSGARAVSNQDSQ
jgi:VWFA-related protein